MSTFSLSDALADLASLKSLLAAQERTGLALNDCQEALFNSWAKRLESLPALSGADQTQLTVAIGDAPFTKTQAAELAKIVLVAGQSSPAHHSTKTQVCARFENFITQDEWLKLRAKDAPQTQRMSILSLRAWLLNLCSPGQPLLLHMVKILAYCQNEWSMSQDDVSAAMKQVQTLIKNRGKARSVPLPFILEYPFSVDGLPELLRVQAYGEHGPFPLKMDIPDLHNILAGAKMRRPRTAPWLNYVPPQYRHLLQNARDKPLGLTLSPSTPQPSGQLALTDGSPLDSAIILNSSSSGSLGGAAALKVREEPPAVREEPPAVRRRIPLQVLSRIAADVVARQLAQDADHGWRAC